MSAYLKREGVDLEKNRTAYGELGQLNAKYGELATDVALAAGGALPPPAGTAADLASLGRSLWKGDWGGALLDVVGLVPIAGDAAKAGKIANKLNDLRRSIDVAKSGMKKAFQKQKDAAARYWDDAVKANRKAYDDAIKSCTTKACRESKAKLKGPQYEKTPKSGPNGQWKGERGDSVWEPTNGGPPITYKNGFPDYSGHATQSVDIPMTGKRSSDDRLARDAVREQLGDPNWKKPKGYTWHHNQNGTTMELVPESVHATGKGASTPHRGGAAVFDKSGKPDPAF